MIPTWFTAGKGVENFMATSYSAIIQQEGDWWIGWVEEVPGGMASNITYCLQRGPLIRPDEFAPPANTARGHSLRRVRAIARAVR